MSADPIVSAAHHVEDAARFDLPFGAAIDLPSIAGFQITKYMVLEVLAAALLVMILVPLARRMAAGGPPRGRLWNMFEAAILFIRNEIVRPAIGPDHDDAHDHDAHAAETFRGADRFLPFILTVFFFILFCNLLGLVPWLGSPTASINVTGVLALFALTASVGTGMKKFGIGKFWIGLVPKMDLPLAMAVFLVPLIFVLEVFGLFIRHSILAVRLLANMFAGHLVLGVIVGFIPVFVGSFLWFGVTPAAVLGATALSLLELLVAFLQAYIFAFLSALFIGMSIHQH
jgi:F-type H+-transporting ATPase subunit a